MAYVRRMRPIDDDVLRNVVTYSHAQNVDVALLFDLCDICYWYRGWEGCIKDTLFEHRLRHRNRQKESMFTGWYNKETFAVSLARRPDMYQFVQE